MKSLGNFFSFSIPIVFGNSFNFLFTSNCSTQDYGSAMFSAPLHSIHQFLPDFNDIHTEGKHREILIHTAPLIELGFIKTCRCYLRCLTDIELRPSEGDLKETAVTQVSSQELNISEDSIQPEWAFFKINGEIKNNCLYFYLFGNHKTNCFQQMCLERLMLPKFIKRQFIILSLLCNNNSSAFGVSSLVHRGPLFVIYLTKLLVKWSRYYKIKDVL